MTVRKYRWSRHYEAAEEELPGYLEAHKITCERWEAAAGEKLPEDTAATELDIFCAEGSISFTVNGQSFSLQPGDALEIPANSSYSAMTGLTGAVCYESIEN